MDYMQSALAGDLERIIVAEEDIGRRVRELAGQITRHYQSQNITELVVVGILRGAVIFMSDLIRLLPFDITFDFMAISSYGDRTQSSGIVRINKDISDSIEGKHVLIIEDIIDTGTTMSSLMEVLRTRKPHSLAICALLDKPSRRQTKIEADFCGFAIPDEFVVGYGLDFAGKYRHLPCIGVLKPEKYRE